MRALRLWFGFSERVRQRDYLLSGIGLMLLKFCGDAAVFWIASRTVLTPLDYLSPLAGDLAGKWNGLPDPARWALVLWLAPFAWIGVSMTCRRAIDAGLWPGVVVFFFVPVLNYLLMSALAGLSSREPHWRRRRTAPPVPKHRKAVARVGLAVALVFPITFLLLAVNGLERYGPGLFVGTPFVAGVIGGYAMNIARPRTVGETSGGCALGLAVGCALLLVIALEGFACIVMALPIIAPLAWLGSLLGRGLALLDAGGASAASFVVLPAGLLALDERPSSRPEHELVSAIEIDAPPERVWRRVVEFSDLPPSRRWLFKMGIAHPVRARIEGTGEGAVRRCEFSTGAFVEPITRWEEPSRLSFDVTAHPPPMKELSPWGEIHPPHLEGWFRATRGEFRLVPLAGGRTRLEGSTWYVLDLTPELYWRPWAETLVHAIHMEVLEHIKALEE